MTCMATRPPLVCKGWTCDGTNLAVVVPASATLPPAVIRRDLIGLDFHVDLAASESGAPEFTGGDHVHIVIRKPQPVRKVRITTAVLDAVRPGVAPDLDLVARARAVLEAAGCEVEIHPMERAEIERLRRQGLDLVARADALVAKLGPS